MSKEKWRLCENEFPNTGDSVLIKTRTGQVFYAIYSAFDEFDVHRPDNENHPYRKSWYKYSKRTVLKWKYFNVKTN